jgi:hypothetical protein
VESEWKVNMNMKLNGRGLLNPRLLFFGMLMAPIIAYAVVQPVIIRVYIAATGTNIVSITASNTYQISYHSTLLMTTNLASARWIGIRTNMSDSYPEIFTNIPATNGAAFFRTQAN